MQITLSPIGYISNIRTEAIDDNWGNIRSVITLGADYPAEGLDGIEAFSHVIIVYYFDRVGDDKIQTGSRHPRDNASLPKVGIFAQRAKMRPNRIGITTCKLIERNGNQITVEGLDAIDGTPVLDIKPYMKEFDSRDSQQPEWVKEIMKNYF